MRKLLTLILLTLALTGAGPQASAWEREAFKAIKDLAREQAEQAKEKAAREQAEREAAEQAEREKAERAEQADGDPQADPDKAEQTAKERAKWESGDELREQERKRKERQAQEDQEYHERKRQEWEALREQERKRKAEQEEQWRQAEQAERERRAERWAREKAEQERKKAEWERAEQEREMARQAERKRREAEQLCNEYKPLADDFSIVEYAQGKGLFTPDEVKEIREQLNSCNLAIRTAAGDPNCKHLMFAMRVQEKKTFSDRRAALEAEGMYEQMKKAKEYGILTPSQEMEIDGLKNDLWEKRKAKNASQRKFEIMYRQADEAGCLDKQS